MTITVKMFVRGIGTKKWEMQWEIFMKYFKL